MSGVIPLWLRDAVALGDVMPDRTFADTIAAMRETADCAALWALMTGYFTAHGIEKISYHLYRGIAPDSGPAEQPVSVLTEGYSDAWVCHYMQRKLYLIDPIPELARTATRPFLWSDVGRLMRLAPEQRAFLAELELAEIGDGLAFQVYGPNMRNAYIGLGFGRPAPDLSPPMVSDFRYVAQMAHLRYCEMVSDDKAQRFDLAPRERQILHWIARGKSNATIATILDVSPHTIDTLTRRIFDKLGVTDRTSAAIRGVGAGLVLPG